VYKNLGYLTDDEVSELFPSMERLTKGMVAIIECVQNIPCNPCQEACPRHAIKPFAVMTDNPVIDHNLCNGCGLCIGSCPGLAIYVLDLNYTETSSLIKIPYEMLPIPEPEQKVDLFNRSGELIGFGKVIKVQTLKHNPKTRIVWVEIPKELYKIARNIRVVKHD